MSKSNNFESLRVVSITLDESNNSSTYADIDTPAQGLFIKPSPGVPDRDADITGYILSSTDNDGKVEWVAPDTGTLPAPLQSIAGLTTTTNDMLYTIAPNTYNTSTIATVGRSFLGQSTTALQPSALGLEIGVDVQAFSNQLTDLVSIASTADRIAYTVGGSYSGSLITSFARTTLLQAPNSATLIAGLDDLDVAVGFEAVELYHFAGHVVDFDGASHVEDEDVAARAHGTGLEDEVAGFGDGHEVAGDFFVGNGDGAVVFDLFAEEWDDRSVGAEDVAEAGGDEAGLVVGE